MIELWLPRAFSSNAMWRKGKGKTHLSAHYQAWLEECAWEIKRQNIRAIIDRPYKLIVTAKRNARMDLDNILKPINDLLQRLQIVTNDRLCDCINARWVTSGDGVAVRIEPAGIE